MTSEQKEQRDTRVARAERGSAADGTRDTPRPDDASHTTGAKRAGAAGADVAASDADAARQPSTGGRGEQPGAGRGPDAQPYPDRVFRSPSAMASGIALLAVAAWLGIDAVTNGSGRTPLITLAGLLCFAPVIIAFTLRPAVFAGPRQLRVRNPFRTITVPWTSIESLQAGYTSEVIADGAKYQLWSIPVSLRARKGVQRHNERVRAGEPPRNGFMGLGKQAVTSEADMAERRATSDQAIDELRELALRHGEDGDAPSAPGPVVVRWAYELMGPTALGALGLVLLYVTR